MLNQSGPSSHRNRLIFTSNPNETNGEMQRNMIQKLNENSFSSNEDASAAVSTLCSSSNCTTLLGVSQVSLEPPKRINQEVLHETFINELRRHSYHINLTDVLGHGMFGMVFKVTSIKEDRIMAAKVMSILMRDVKEMMFNEVNSSLDRSFEREITAHSLLGTHPNIVALIDSFVQYNEIIQFGLGDKPRQAISVPNFYFILEYTDQGTLQQLVRTLGYLNEDEAKSLAVDLIRAVNHIHKVGVFHLDIKPENLLLFAGGLGPLNLTLKLTDFGVAQCQRTVNRGVGSYTTMAPEMVRNLWMDTNGYSRYQKAYKCARADAWSVGATIFYTLHGYYPLSDSFDFNNLDQVFCTDGKLEKRGKRYRSRMKNLLVEPHPELTWQCKNVLNNLLKINPKHRVRITETMLNHWIDESNHGSLLKSCLFLG